MAAFALAGAQVEQLRPGLDVAEALDTVLADVDPDIRRSLGALLAMNEGKDDDDMSFDFLRRHFFGGGAMHEDAMPRGGYRGVVDALAEGLPIHLETTVERIAQDDDGVTVHTSSGAFDGSHVLVTVPLGVLKAAAIEFDPPLPAGHLAAIERMGFGVLEKVVIAYDRAVWQVDGAPTHVTIVDSGGPGWPMILDLSTWYGSPVVVGFATGARGRVLAGMAESDRVAALHETICALSPARRRRPSRPWRRAGRPTRSCWAATPTSPWAPSPSSTSPTSRRSRDRTVGSSSRASTRASSARRPSTRPGTAGCARHLASSASPSAFPELHAAG